MSESRHRRWVETLRTLAWLSLVLALLSIFRQPFDRVLGHHLRPALSAVGADRLLGTAAAPGFMLQITSRPAGATVLLAGVARGTTPALLNVVCRQGEEISIEIELDGRRAERRVECREGGRLHVDLPLPTRTGPGGTS